jgi:hypothetical protein
MVTLDFGEADFVLLVSVIALSYSSSLIFYTITMLAEKRAAIFMQAGKKIFVGRTNVFIRARIGQTPWSATADFEA